MDHAGWAVLVTVANGALVDRRRVELVDAALPAMPHHHEGQHMPIADAVRLVARVRASAEEHARTALAALADAHAIDAIALRARDALPATVEERITSYRAMCVADWVMYRDALADAATARGWRVHWFDAKRVLAPPRGAAALAALLARAGKSAGSPWQKDHKVAMAAALAVAGRPR
jgi:hypothetical protein